MNFPVRLLLALLLALNTLPLRAADDPLAWPPLTSQAKPWAFNWWMGSAVDKTNLTRELERYAAAGLGGIHIIPIYGAKGFEDKYIPYLSPQWMEMMGWAVSEAKRLGMGVDMTTGSGWCFGGPQVTDEDANANVVCKTYELKPGEKLTQKYNKAATQALVAYGPDGKVIELTDNISATGEVDWTAPDKVGQASRLPGERDSASGSGTGILPVSSNAPTLSARAGETPALHWTVYAISQKPSGQKVKRAGPGGEGWMLNLIYPSAMDDFLKPYTAAFASYTGPKPRAQYHDSYEYRSDWSPNFFAQFEKRRGYKLQNELPALFRSGDASSPKGGGAAPVAGSAKTGDVASLSPSATGASQLQADHRARVLCDYRQTVSEIMAEESLPKWVNWSHEHGFLTRNQAHGSPGNWLDLYAAADIPETEMFHTDRNKLISKFASSAAHVTGKPLVSAETGTWIEEHFTEKLSDVKYLMDDLFLSGVNHLFYHGVCYSPDEAGWPGWHFYASLEMNPRNSIWRDAPALNAYAARVQSVLQSGQPDNDILLYWNIADFWMQPGDKLLPQLTVHARDWFENQPIGKTAKELWEKGYAFDYVSDAQLKAAKVVDGKVQMPGGKYQVIVVPPCDFIPFETYKQLLDLAESGATVIFKGHFPKSPSGLSNLKEKRASFAQFSDKIIFFEMGKLGKNGPWMTPCNLPSTLTNEKGVPCEPLVDAGLSVIRRSVDGGWNYFIANRGTNNFDGLISLGREAKSVVILDPMTGQTGNAQIKTNYDYSPDIKSFIESGSLESIGDEIRKKELLKKLPKDVPHKMVYLQLCAGESVILRAFADKEVEGPAWNYWQPQTPDAKPQTLPGPWNVKFILGGPTLPADFQTAQLASWTTFLDTNLQAFAGTAKYETTFDAPERRSPTRRVSNDTTNAPGRRPALLSEAAFALDLGNVQQSARVKLNGKDYGTLITPPFRVIVDNLKPTGNTLEVEVTSTDANRIRDLDRRGVPWKTFRDINFVNINYKPFDASNWPLTDCGLLGPVTLTPVVAE